MSTNQPSRQPQSEPLTLLVAVAVVFLVCTATVYVLYQHPSLTAPAGVGVGLLGVLVPLVIAALRRR
ncbi:hypothetical protein ACIG63_40025 [Streptomyces antimycoticus]|uniref:hypothetical protein n=1 Tax=Streptomyces antimycoticus TaxID=68175 RepID=UPI0037D8F486